MILDHVAIIVTQAQSDATVRALTSILLTSEKKKLEARVAPHLLALYVDEEACRHAQQLRDATSDEPGGLVHFSLEQGQDAINRLVTRTSHANVVLNLARGLAPNSAR